MSNNKEQPNILLIIMDDVRQDHFSCYGYKRKTTPFIDSLADESIIFDNAYTTGPWSPPSHASIFSGLYPSEHGVQHGHLWLDIEIPTLAEKLTDVGYETISLSNNAFVGPETGLDRGFSRFDEIWKRYHLGEAGFSRAGWRRTLRGFRRFFAINNKGAEFTNEVLINWLQNERDTDKPFFVFINYLDTHPICNSPRSFMKMFPEVRYSYFRMFKLIRAWTNKAAFASGKIKFSEKMWEFHKWLYDVAILYLDSKIRELYEVMKEIKILDDTIIIITGDHGENFGEHGLITHESSIYEESLRVPLIVRYPRLPSDLRIDNPVQLMDLYYLILSQAGIKSLESGREGRFLDMEKVINGEKSVRPVFVEYARPPGLVEKLEKMCPGYNYSRFDRGYQTIIVHPYKYIKSSKGDEELYNLSKDPKELDNLVMKDTENLERMRKRFDDFASKLVRKGQAEEPQDKGLTKEEEDEIKSRLKEMGYI